jgi:hypothetical protein
MMASRYGSFNVEIPVGCEDPYDTHLNNGCYSIFPKYHNIKKYNSYITIPMITQNELADGWLLVHPNTRSYFKTVVNEAGEKVNTRVNGSYHFKVNLAQLPENLWHKLNFLNERSYYVNDGLYDFTVLKTPVDDEIRELYHLTKQMKCPEHKERLQELLTVLKDNDVYGWVVIRARNMYRN